MIQSHPAENATSSAETVVLMGSDEQPTSEQMQDVRGYPRTVLHITNLST
jgi:hypothetical protein